MAPGSSTMSEDAQGHFDLKSMIFSLVTPFMLKAVVLLGIPEMISKAGPLSLKQIVSRLSNPKNCQPDLLERILQFLVHKRALSEKIEKDGETYYGLTPISKWLAEEHHLLLLCTHEYPMAAFQKVNEAVLDGGHAYEMVNKVRLWEHDPGHGDEYVELLNKATLAWSTVTISLVLEHYDGFKDVKKLVDVGGGLGMCMGKIVEKYPHIEGVNFDLPHTVSSAPAFPGVAHVGGNMFESVPSADALLIKSVIINFSDEDCLRMLANCYKALPRGGKLIVIELIYSKERPFEMDLDMIMIGFTDGGKTRRFEEHKALLENSGFGNVSLVSVPSKEQVIEAYKL
ncbi:anthranilate N-methyltransferase [Selaginella moellendorffii]|nr:anthranilate N-methyltransferase [Selaginella moellendorffii]|eukprot:XP_002971518.2 anthranilate N-methyltransferase [Selaginella moellendorffii]